MFADHKKERERIKKLRASPAARASEMWGRKNLPGSLPANEEAAPTWHAPRPPLPIPLFLSPRRWSLQLIGGSGAHTNTRVHLLAPLDCSYLAAGVVLATSSPWATPRRHRQPTSEWCVCAVVPSLQQMDGLGYYCLLLALCVLLLVQVHHMIEKCICFNLSKEECMDALEKHANVKPVVTSTGTVPAVLASYRACILDTTCIICFNNRS